MAPGLDPNHRAVEGDSSARFEPSLTTLPSQPGLAHPIARVFLFVTLFLFFNTLMALIPAVRQPLLSMRSEGMATAYELIASDGLQTIGLLLSAAAMAFLEKRSFADYGLPLSPHPPRLLSLGALAGFVAITAFMGVFAAIGTYSPGGLARTGGDAVKYGVLFAMGFLLVGFVEEFLFRGYLQSTLGALIGFWPAAIVLSLVFGAIHLGNRGETRFGVLTAAAFGLIAAFALRRTGNLWFGIGMHAAWDWGQSFVYSVSDSGVLARNALLQSTMHGPNWLTGGSVGPEGSVLVIPILLLWTLAIHWMFPARRAVT